MPATSEQIARVKAMVGDPLLSTTAATTAIERYPLLDGLGQPPFVLGSLSEVNPDWISTYDLHAAAADLLEEQAAVLAKDFDFATENERFERSQKYSQTLNLARWHRSRRVPKTADVVVWPPPDEESSC